MKYPQLPTFAFFAAGLLLIPLPSHLRARNVATLSIIAWLFTVDLIFAINSLLWAGNVDIKARVWCDIATKVVVGASYALPLATLCVFKHLEMVSSSRKTSFDHVDRRHRMLFEAVMCFGVPFVFMVLHYIVQGHRFDIFENTGCQAAVYISVPAVMIIWFPQLLFSIITMIYAAIALHHFIQRRLTFASHLQISNSALTTNRYLRLIAMAITEMIWGVALTTFNLYNNLNGGLRPWTNWADVHSDFSRVDQFPEFIIPPQFLKTVYLFWWAMPVSSFIFFLFFGFGEEVKKDYVKIWCWMRKTRFASPQEKEDMVKIGSSFGSLGLKPLKLVDHKNSSTTNLPISNPMLVSSSIPSLHTSVAPSPTKFESRTPQPATTHGETHIDTYSTFSISTFSTHAQPCNLAHPSRSSAQGSGPPDAHIDDQLPQLPEIHLSPPLSTPPPPSPTLSLPESVGATFHESSPRPGCLPSPVYHRPFCAPSIYPVTNPYSNAQQGIVVTVHRQASVDDMA